MKSLSATRLLIILFSAVCVIIVGHALATGTGAGLRVTTVAEKKKTMKVEIWSDVMCPFCYIGKRRLEQALADFEHRDDVTIIWKSFQLNPEMKTEPGKKIEEYLAESKGWTLSYARQMNDYVSGMAREAGLEYHLNQAVVANTFDAHRLIHLAHSHGLGDAMKERLLKAYFTEGRNIGDHETLVDLADAAGLDREETWQVLRSERYGDAVEQDIYEAGQVGVRGVPFFVFNDKYAISGAQAQEVFLQTLHKAWKEHVAESGSSADGSTGQGGAACTPEGACD